MSGPAATVARTVLATVLFYALLGAAVALPSAVRGVASVDPVARRSSVGFRLVIIPGSIYWWPIVLRRRLAVARARS